MQNTKTSAIPTQHLKQHPDPEAPQRLHLTQHLDPAGLEDPCIVFLAPSSEGDDSDMPGVVYPASICVGGRVDLSPTQAREVAARLIELADLVTPADPLAEKALEAAAHAIGERVGNLAKLSGIDPLADFTVRDIRVMSATLGRILGS